MPAGGELGIKTGEYWAYRQGTTHTLQRALILNPGTHYDSNIRIRLVDDAAVTELWTRRAKLPCKWAEVELYLLAHPDVPQSYAQTPGPPDPVDPIAFSANELRAIIHDEVTNALRAEKISYTYQQAATALGISTTVLRGAVKRHYLIPRYVGHKALFTPDELRQWVESLPDEPWHARWD